jgi:hypothetical protein
MLALMESPQQLLIKVAGLSRISQGALEASPKFGLMPKPE